MSTGPAPAARSPSSFPLHAARCTTKHPQHSNDIGIMVALHRDALSRDLPFPDCCVRTLIQHLAFDPELQDRVWYSTRSARRNPSLRCPGNPKGGTCDLPTLLDSLGFDPVAQTISWQRSKEPLGGGDRQLGALVAHLSRLSTSCVLKSSTVAPSATVRVRPRHHQKTSNPRTQDSGFSHKNLLLPGRARKVLGNLLSPSNPNVRVARRRTLPVRVSCGATPM